MNSMENKAKKINSNDISSKRKVLESQHSSTLPSLDELDVGERIPPEGASAESPNNTDAVSDLMKASENDEELHMLRRLISEGRISGLNEKPPPFIPPTPPSKSSPKRQSEGHQGSSKTNEEKIKPPAPAGLKHPKQEFSQATKSGDRPRKAREAPKPPAPTVAKNQQIQGSSSADIKFIAGRRINSVESINDDKDAAGAESGVRRGAKREPKSEGIKRSTSMHVPKEPRGDEQPDRSKADDAALAQLIADSTE